MVLPGSHKSNFKRPKSLFNEGTVTDELPAGVVNVTPRAGDMVIMPEAMTHGILPWKPQDRIRRILVLRYRPQHRDGGIDVPEGIRKLLSPQTQKLIETAHYTHVKEIAKKKRAAA